jgi:hypothetical protein
MQMTENDDLDVLGVHAGGSQLVLQPVDAEDLRQR